MERPRSPEDWGKVFEEARPTYVAFCDRLEEMLEDRLDEEEILYSIVYGTVDTVDTFVQRIYRATRDGLHIGDPLEDLLDFARVEVTAYSPEELDRIETLVRVELEVDDERSTSVAAASASNEDPTPRPGDDRLGYQTAKIVVSLPDLLARAWRGFGGLRATIDIRTSLQDAWAGLDRYYLPYYRHSSYPPEARRAIEEAVVRCFEADNALAGIWSEIYRADERYADAMEEGDLELPLDARSLRSYVQGSKVVDELAAVARAEGMEPAEFDDTSWVLEQRMLPVLRGAGIESISELDAQLRDGIERAKEILEDVVRLSAERGFRPFAVPEDVILFLLLVLSRADAETIRLAEYTDEVDYALNTLIGNPVRYDQEEE